MNSNESVFQLIRLSLWNTGTCRADASTYITMKQHALLALPAAVLSSVSVPDDLRQRWQTEIYQQLLDYQRYRHAEKTLPVTVPYAILKGSAAAQYYPHPEYRTMGDIDLMTRHEDYEAACSMLLEAGFFETTVPEPYGVTRHRAFQKGQTEVEVHAYFARLNDPAAAEYLDRLIIDSISPDHALPDFINGLVILAHISQHLEEGLGLRQVIDWMMFAERCLSDGHWPAFQPMAARIGLEKLAAAVTRMCEMYLGLPRHAWCSGTDEALCARLMNYILDCGNFGKTHSITSKASERVLSVSRSPAAFFTLLQRYGRFNWKACQRHAFLRPFAWLYQLCRYIRKGLSRKNTFRHLKSEAQTVRERDALFEALGAGQLSKGYAVYKEGRYMKD